MRQQEVNMKISTEVIIALLASFAISVVLSPIIIPFLKRLKIGQTERTEGVQSHLEKAGTPTMGGLITPHFGVEVREDDGTLLETLSYKEGKQIVSEQVSKTMRMILEKVVSEGGGKKAYIEGYHIGGKTATSETLPRSANKYISSFLGFVPAEDPRILGICIINNPQGVYYGGTICAPVMRTVFENILPYLGIEKEAAQETDAVRTMDQVEHLLSAE